jgi:hypothetical protein
VKHWERLKWVAAGSFVIATVMMLSQYLAAKSTLPWITYLIGNSVWMLDSIHIKNWPWVWLSAFFVVWDIVLIIDRLFFV